MKLKWILCAAVLALGWSYADGSLLEDNFDSYAPGSEPVPPWTRLPGTGGISVDAAASYPEGGSSLHFKNAADAHAGLARAFEPASKVVIEYYLRNHDSESVSLRPTGDAGDDWGAVFLDTGYIGLSDGNSQIGTFIPYSLDTWYRVRLEMDASTGERTFEFTKVGDPANTSSWKMNWGPPNTHVSGVSLVTSLTKPTDSYVDDIVVVPEPAVLSLLAMGVLPLLGGRPGPKARRR